MRPKKRKKPRIQRVTISRRMESASHFFFTTDSFQALVN